MADLESSFFFRMDSATPVELLLTDVNDAVRETGAEVVLQHHWVFTLVDCEALLRKRIARATIRTRGS